MANSQSIRETQDFFSSRAAGWEERFPDDGPQFVRVVEALNLSIGVRALDLGCGTGRAVVPLRESVGGDGHVIGLDATLPMLDEVQRLGRGTLASLLQGDAMMLPFQHACFDVILASGLLPHLDEPAIGLAEMSRVTKPGGKLAIFHPLSRKALAARHHSVPSDDDVLAGERLTRLCESSGWILQWIDDAEDRYLALAVKQ